MIKKIGLQERSSVFRENFSHLLMLREECAQSVNKHRGHSVSDQQIIRISEKLPTTERDYIK